MKKKETKKHNKVKQLKAVLLENEEFHEIEINNFKIMVYPVIIYLSVHLVSFYEPIMNISI